MKYISVILAAIFLSSSALGALTISRNYETEILGNWICKDIWPRYVAFEMIRYKKDGTWNSFGEVIIDFDLEKAIESKLERNAEKYPVNLSKGNAQKYNQRGE